MQLVSMVQCFSFGNRNKRDLIEVLLAKQFSDAPKWVQGSSAFSLLCVYTCVYVWEGWEGYNNIYTMHCSDSIWGNGKQAARC